MLVALGRTAQGRPARPKLLRIGHAHGYPFRGFGHWCPGCRVMHAFATDEPDLRGRRWTWNGSVRTPTFWPAMDLVTIGYRDLAPAARCHYALTGGILAFSELCTHALKGQSVPLPELAPHLID